MPTAIGSWAGGEAAVAMAIMPIIWPHVWPILLFAATVLALGLKTFRRPLDRGHASAFDASARLGPHAASAGSARTR